MLYFTIISIGLYYLISTTIGICYYVNNYYRNDYLFEQSNNGELNIELDYDCFKDFEDYYDNCLSNNKNKYYFEHFDYIFLNVVDEKLTKYFNIN